MACCAALSRSRTRLGSRWYRALETRIAPGDPHENEVEKFQQVVRGMIQAERQESWTKLCELTSCRCMLTDLVGSPSRLPMSNFYKLWTLQCETVDIVRKIFCPRIWDVPGVILARDGVDIGFCSICCFREGIGHRGASGCESGSWIAQSRTKIT